MRLCWLAVVLSAGCIATAPADGGQFGEESGAACAAIERTALGLDEPSTLGFTPQSVLDLAAGEHAATLAWEGGGATPLAFTVAPVEGGAVELVDYEVRIEGGGEEPAIEIGCADLLEIEVDVTFATEDGAFDEHWTGRLTSPVEGSAGFHHDLDAVEGTFDPWDHAPEGSDFDEMRAWVDLSFADDGVSGTVEGQGSGTGGNPNDPDSVAYAQNVPVATF